MYGFGAALFTTANLPGVLPVLDSMHVSIIHKHTHT